MAEGAPVIPISAQLKYNIEVVCEYIEKKIPVPLRDFTSEPHLIIIRLNSVFVKQQPIFEHMKTHIRSNYLCSPRGPTSQIGLKSMPEPVV